MCKNVVEPNRPQMTVWGMRIAGWIPKATDTLSEYVILIAFLTRLNAIRTLPVLFTNCMGTDPTTFLSYPCLKDEVDIQYVTGRAGVFRIERLRSNDSYGAGKHSFGQIARPVSLPGFFCGSCCCHLDQWLPLHHSSSAGGWDQHTGVSDP